MSPNSTTSFSWKSVILFSIGIGLLIAGLSLFLKDQVHSVQGVSWSGDQYPIVTISSTATHGLGSSFEVSDIPVRLVIPSIEVDAAIQSVGLSKSGNVGIPTNFVDVAWYNQGVRPGMPGSAVIDGHLDGKKVPEAVFYNLQNLKRGDLVEIIDKRGKTLRFRVVDTKIYDYNASTTEIFSGDASRSRLNLITCAGSWIKTEKLYDKRVVVFTELVVGE